MCINTSTRHIKIVKSIIRLKNLSRNSTFCCHMELSSIFWLDDRDLLFPIPIKDNSEFAN